MSPSGTGEHSTGGGAGQFAETHWSLVLLAGQRSSPQAAQALESLCRAYWYPIYAFVRRKGFSPHDAQDLTQEFFARLLRKNTFAEADQAKGKFRSFLLGALKHFLSDEWDKLRAEKRGGKLEFVSLDDTQNAERCYAEEPELTPEKTFDRRWALTLLQRTLTRLKEEFTAAGKARQFDLLKPFLTGAADPSSYDAVAAQLETTTNGVAVSVHRLRQRYRELVRAEVAQTVANPAEVNEELRHLFG